MAYLFHGHVYNCTSTLTAVILSKIYRIISVNVTCKFCTYVYMNMYNANCNILLIIRSELIFIVYT